ncbi:hypothetical protein VLK81_09630 [Citroniella saccharovorans]|uniref:Uncharacterized protein n=1 Tax=Citroniella saccharovorans TaxID=2053367 RepID=A0AAW9MZE3_9FIRM|nr:hypothetical protein [Citroniella saccharovorans]MEB3428870.1 hypothetical protein [Citroniella saccharovorans]MEB3428917.1 hypothetical protein [Citroniella saccharovorans]MEB3430243.1 hypothetical protein [Citroniella saccharovorans]
MPNVKMKIKARKGKVEVTYESKVDQAQYLITELSRAALRDTAKYLRKIVVMDLKKLHGMKRHRRPYNTQYWVRNKEADLQIGFKHGAWYSVGQELGDMGMRKVGSLRNTTYDNIDQIQQIQAQYLSALNGEPSDPGDAEYKSPPGEE